MKKVYVKLIWFYDNVITWNSNKIKPLTRKLMTKNKNKLFDILACSCSLPVLDCSDRNIKCPGCPNLHIYCSCDIQFKVTDSIFIPNLIKLWIEHDIPFLFLYTVHRISESICRFFTGAAAHNITKNAKQLLVVRALKYL